MTRTRHGRIARLPREIREELNRRLDEGEEGRHIVGWLNRLPEVKALNDAGHGGKPIRAQNLSEWRKGGYLDWQERQRVLEIAESLAEDSANWESGSRAPLTDTLAHWVAGRYAVATRRIATADDDAAWQYLREFCRDLTELRKGDHSAARLLLEGKRLELDEKHGQEAMERLFREWAKKPGNENAFREATLSVEQQNRRLREILR